MDRRHARYPFFESARAAVEAADVDIGALVGGDETAGGTGEMVVERARERVETALSEGHVGVGDETGMHRSARIELLSYPIARILVSLLEEPMAIDAYARAEASTARQRLQADLPEPGGASDALGGGGGTGPPGGGAASPGGSTGSPGDGTGSPSGGSGSPGASTGGRGGVTGESAAATTTNVGELLGEFGLADAVSGRDPFGVDVAVYLELSRDLDGEEWALVNRSLSAGRVPVNRGELYDLLERAVADRVAEGLPLSVPDPVADGLAEPREAIEGMLADEEIPLAFDRVEPEQFPPCMTALLERARHDETLPAHSQYSLVGFLGATGMDAPAIVDLAGDGLDRETVDFQLAHVRDGDSLEYAPPSCASMDAYGDCVNRDERCDTIDHPLSYYESALADVDAD